MSVPFRQRLHKCPELVTGRAALDGLSPSPPLIGVFAELAKRVFCPNWTTVGNARLRIVASAQSADAAEVGFSAWRQPIADLEAFGGSECLELADILLQRKPLAAQDTGEFRRNHSAATLPPLDHLAHQLQLQPALLGRRQRT